ncbi:putative GH25 family protein [Limimaricola soesokkakensis]|uniref:Nickel uptake substrate-specific transmembrane region n=1 Tax=Limimaricola soesokkakensis TaxID=1343159 RepID=A0A1X6ZFQ4_9RHOB|nr:DUF4198 domain-containing protein [Limimaricola soesokkakensis]PSK86103.1 putative GH25 family protein [Limimaricola soesokkakensis]SLN50451.1 Nickel uptake substrate-specific transmembrane region [Limimaricola soesokkakensis]
MRVITACLFLLSTPVAAHEFWIEPLEWQIAADDMVRAELVNGDLFEGIRYAYLPQRFESFDLHMNGEARPVEGRLGARPALDMSAPEEGLLVASYVSKPSIVTYDDRAVFERFVAHKDLGAVAAVHAARGLPEAGFREVFTRYSKALFGVGAAQGADSRLGLATELVALDNPYTDDPSQGLRVQLFYDDAPRANAQVELFARDADGDVELTLHRTDAEGVARLPVVPGHDYLVNAVVLREPDNAMAIATGAVWESLWAALTFTIPD